MLTMVDKFGKRLRELREAKGMTQKELGDVVRFSPSTIGMYESGRRDPDSDTLRVLAELFQVSTDYLLGRTDDRGSSLSEAPAPYGDKLGINDDQGDWPKGYRIIAREMDRLSPEQRRKVLIKLLEAGYPEELPGRPSSDPKPNGK